MKRADKNESNIKAVSGISKKSVVIKHDGVDNVMDAISKIINIVTLVGKELFSNIDKYISKPMTLDEVAQTYSHATDKVILEAMDEKIKFVGGKFKIATVKGDLKNIEVSFEAYLQNENNKWIKKSDKRIISSSKLNEESLKELFANSYVEYEIEKPIAMKE